MTSSIPKASQMAMNGPIFFLIQKQAKSEVAIKTLQTRMAVLEGLQERLMQAVDDVHQHICQNNPTVKPTNDSDCHSIRKIRSSNTNSTKNICNNTSFSSTKSNANEKKLRFVDSTSKSEASPNLCAKDSGAKSDSLNKDSGLGASDCSLAPEDDDELLRLLDLIDQRSSLLVQRQTEMLESTCEDKPSPASMLDDLLLEKVGTQRKLSEVKAERDQLKKRLENLQLATNLVNKQTNKVQRQLNSTLTENQNLQDRINKAKHLSSPKSMGYLLDIERANVRKKYLEISEKSKKKVSAILKEGNVLELQKQLLAFVMENDILQAKLQQDESSRIGAWLAIESQLRKDLRETKNDKSKLREVLESKSLEIASLKDKIRAMEEYSDTDSNVKNFGMDSTDDWRAGGTQNIYDKRMNLNENCPFSPLGYGDFSKTQSLPVNLLGIDSSSTSKQQQCNIQTNYKMYDTNSFTDIPLSQSFEAGHSKGANERDLVDLSVPHHSSTSTLIHPHNSHQMSQPNSGFSAPNLNANVERDVFHNWGFASKRYDSNCQLNGSAKLVNGHLCWKSTDRLRHPINGHNKDISSICSEFDPLSEGNDENFEDSLNLSIPLQPTQIDFSHLSFIGDSLHSATSDLGCVSTPVIHRQSKRNNIARSVDGIRELLLDRNYCSDKKRSARQPLGKPIPHLPVNILNYMNERSDYSLL